MANRFYNLPGEISEIGRKLQGDYYSALTYQLESNEVLVGLYIVEPTGYPAATHIDSPERYDEIQIHAPISYYAVDKKKVNEKMDPKIP